MYTRHKQDTAHEDTAQQHCKSLGKQFPAKSSLQGNFHVPTYH